MTNFVLPCSYDVIEMNISAPHCLHRHRTTPTVLLHHHPPAHTHTHTHTHVIQMTER